VLIRTWRKADLPAVHEIARETFLDAYGSFIPRDVLEEYLGRRLTRENFARYLGARHLVGLLAVEDGRPAAFARFRHEIPEGRAYLGSLYVRPAFQGCGIGTRLLREAERLALRRGLPALWVGVMTQNTPALAWYQRESFLFVEEKPFSMGRVEVPHLIGRKSLVPAG
jgi:ribosomal protein S18 acetylase RimI-like enzyme